MTLDGGSDTESMTLALTLKRADVIGLPSGRFIVRWYGNRALLEAGELADIFEVIRENN